MFFIRDLFYIAAFFYLLSLGISILCRGKLILFFRCLLFIGLFANLLSITGRYYFSWPLMPMYQVPFFLPLVIGVLLFKTIWHKQAGCMLLVCALCLLSMAAVFFPNDFYLPFLESRTFFSHLFFGGYRGPGLFYNRRRQCACSYTFVPYKQRQRAGTKAGKVEKPCFSWKQDPDITVGCLGVCLLDHLHVFRRNLVISWLGQPGRVG